MSGGIANPLTDRMKSYIDANHNRMYVSEMATNLKVTRHWIELYMKENNLEQKRPRTVITKEKGESNNNNAFFTHRKTDRLV